MIHDPLINELHYYNINKDGSVTKKNFFGKAIAWILNAFGIRTAYDIFVNILPLLQTPHGPLLSLRGRVTFQQDDYKKIGIANTLFQKKPTITLAQAIIESIEGFKEDSRRLLEAQSSTNDFLQLMQQDKQQLLDQFEKDTEKHDHWEIGSQSIDPDKIEAALKAKLETQYTPTEAAQRLEEIKLYANQKLGTILCAGQANCTQEIRSKCVPAKIESLQLLHKLPDTVRAAENSVTYHFSDDLKELAYEITWDVKLRNQTSQATFKSRVTINLETHALSFEPLFDIEIAEDCSVEDRQILSRIFTTPASQEYFQEIDRVKLMKLKLRLMQLNEGSHVLLENDPNQEFFKKLLKDATEEELLDLFAKDAHRMTWKIGEEVLSSFGVESEIRSRLGQQINQEMPGHSDAERAQEVENRLNRIKMYGTQSLGNAICFGQGNFAAAIRAKTTYAKITQAYLEDPSSLLRVIVSLPVVELSSDFKTLVYTATLTISRGENADPKTNVKADVKARVIINLETGRLVFEPFFDFKPKGACSRQDIEVLHSALMKPADLSLFEENQGRA